VNHAGLSYNGKMADVVETFQGELHGQDLGPLVAIRFADGLEVALPPSWLRPIEIEP
jgi:hypothetical protein